MRHIIQITVFIRMIKVNCRRHCLSLLSHDTKNRFHTPGSPQQMTELTFGAGNHQTVGMTAEDLPNRIGFSDITQRSTGAMRVDIVNLIGGNSRVPARRLSWHTPHLCLQGPVLSGESHRPTFRNR
jgi:hypothetical protein